jgi:hypothetical protein
MGLHSIRAMAQKFAGPRKIAFGREEMEIVSMLLGSKARIVVTDGFDQSTRGRNGSDSDISVPWEQHR